MRAQIDVWIADALLAGFGIASFGPIQLDPAHPDFGRILRTPKPGWAGAAIAARLTNGLHCPWRIDTDVNGAALAEYRWGAGVGCTSLCYVTIGTGLGGGVLIRGQPVHSALHPELGHMRLRRVAGDPFVGVCPFHGDCAEGLVSGPALHARFGMDAATAPDDHPEWHHVAADIAELCSAILLATSAQRILFGGSVALSRSFLLPWVSTSVVDRLGGYLPFIDGSTIDNIIQSAGLGTESGPFGRDRAGAIGVRSIRDLTPRSYFASTVSIKSTRPSTIAVSAQPGFSRDDTTSNVLYPNAASFGI